MDSALRETGGMRRWALGLVLRSALLTRLSSRLLFSRDYSRLLAERVSGPYRYATDFSRTAPLEEKFQSIRSEFAGAPLLCFEMACRIIRIRRNDRALWNWLYVYGAVLNGGDQIFRSMTSRWIVSVLDTFSDMPSPATYRSAAEQIRNFSLGVRLGYSMALQHVRDPATLDEPQPLQGGFEIWDGVAHFYYLKGDTYSNLLLRSRRAMSAAPELHEAWKTILARMTLMPPFRTAFLTGAHSRTVFEAEVGTSMHRGGPYDFRHHPE